MRFHLPHQPTRPILVYVPKKKLTLVSVPKRAAPIKTSDVKLFCPSQSYERPEKDIFEPDKGHEVNHPDFSNYVSKNFCQALF